jgi:hypothetical protein
MKVWMLIAALSLAQARPEEAATGRWQWRGTSGWQRIEMSLKAEGTKLTGTIRMGPGAEEPKSNEELWEYFFDPVDFKISDGTVTGNRISFEQDVTRTAGGRLARGGITHPTRYLYKGLVEGDQIVMTREVVPDEKDPWSMGNQKIEFVLQRVK